MERPWPAFSSAATPGWIHYYVGGKAASQSLRTADERVALQKKRQLEALDELDQLARPSSTPVRGVVQAYCEYLARTRPRKSAKNDISYLRSFFGTCCRALELGSRVWRRQRHRPCERPWSSEYGPPAGCSVLLALVRFVC